MTKIKKRDIFILYSELDRKEVDEMIRNNLKELREKKDMTQEQLAKVSGVSRTIISQIEQGKPMNLKISTMVDLAKGVGEKVGTVFILQ